MSQRFKNRFLQLLAMVIFTKRNGLENVTNEAIHEINKGDEKKIPPSEPEQSNLQSEQPKNKEETTTPRFTYGTNSKEVQSLSVYGVNHTFTPSGNQLQCTCCPEPVLIGSLDLEKDGSIKPEEEKGISYTNSEGYTLQKEKASLLYK